MRRGESIIEENAVRKIRGVSEVCWRSLFGDKIKANRWNDKNGEGINMTMTGSELSDKRVLIFAGPDYEDSELMYPLLRFKEAGAEVKVAGLGEKTYQGKKGTTVDVDGSAEDFVVGYWDLVVIPGGWAPDKMRMNEAVLKIVRKAVESDNLVAAICHAGWVLVSADVVQGKKVTSYRAIKDDMVNAGATWVDAEVVVDGNLVTSRTPADLPAFCRTLVSLMTQTLAVPTA